MLIFLNGRLVPDEQANINFQDAGFQHAVGLFETMLARRGRVFRAQAHLDRLTESGRMLGLFRDLNTAPLIQAIHQTIRENQLTDARIRLTVTAGNVSLLKPPTDSLPAPTLLIQATPPTPIDPAFLEQGVKVVLAPPGGANPMDALSGHKTLGYWARLRLLRQATAIGAQEAIMTSVTDALASGCISNLFIVKDGRLMTPLARGEQTVSDWPSPVLPGITRACVIELAQAQGLAVEKLELTTSDLADADEVFLTNSSWGILPVVQVQNRTVGHGQVGETTKQLMACLNETIDRETQDIA